MRDRPAFMITALRTHMVKGGAIAYVDFHDLVETRSSRTVFKQCQAGAFVQLDNMVQDRI